MKKKLTPTTVAKTEAHPTADVWVWDTEVEGFGLRIKPSGRRIFLVRYRTQSGVQRKQTIGLASVLTPEKARELARGILTKVAEGLDPMAQREPAEAPTNTVEAMFTAYAANLRSKGRASAGEVERALLKAKNNAADALGRTTPVTEVTAAQIVDYVAGIFKGGHRGAADKHRSYIASAFQWAIESANDYTVTHRQHWGLTHNPATDVPKDNGAVGTRDRNLSADELKQLWQDTRPGNSPGFSLEVAACIRLLIACGQRVQETLRIEGSEIDLKEALWKMPAHKTKGGKHPHTVPLPKQVLPDLQLLIDVHGQGALFPARSGSKLELIDHRSVMQALDRWMEERKVPAFQTRDLRRTWKSRTGELEMDPFICDMIQQHAQAGTAKKYYNRAQYLPKMRREMATWSAWIDANLEDKPALTLVA